MESVFLGQQSLGLPWRATGWYKPECCAAMRRMSRAAAGPGHMCMAGGERLNQEVFGCFGERQRAGGNTFPC